MLQTAARGDAAAMEECAICFEPAPAVKLVCDCRQTYCKGCLDKALVTSVEIFGAPRCPTCRATFAMDADPGTGKLRLVRRASATELESADGMQAWIKTTAHARRALQIKLLKDHGRRLSRRAGPSGSAPPPEDAEALARWEPRCVCGSPLELVEMRRRISSSLELRHPGWREHLGSQELVEECIQQAEVDCDLCGLSAVSAGRCWTCLKTDLVHPSGNDVCPRCYEEHLAQGAALSYPGPLSLLGLSHVLQGLLTCQAL